MKCLSLKTCIAAKKEECFSHAGFTLIELMIVVGIIGIFVSIAVPQYGRYQRRAKQSEAKLALGAIYSLEKSFFAEYAAYAPSFDAIGYASEGASRAYAHLACYGGNGAQVYGTNSPYTGTITGYSGALTTPEIVTTNTKWTNLWVTTGNACNNLICGSLPSDPQTIIPSAYGTLCPGCVTDMWQITDLKVLTNCHIGI